MLSKSNRYICSLTNFTKIKPMKRKLLLILFFASVMFTGCNQSNTRSYNDTIVDAHKLLFEATNEFLSGSLDLIGKPESKKQLLKVIDATRKKLIEAQKPVEDLLPLNDKGLRQKMLEMFSTALNSMDGLEANIDILTKKDSEPKAAIMLKGVLSSLLELDESIKEIQVEYAESNNAELR